MQTQEDLFIYYDEYQDLDTSKISRIFLKNGTILEIKNNLNKFDDKTLNINSGKYNNAKIKKFNSFSTKVNDKSKDNNGISNGFYVVSIPDAPKRIIPLKVEEKENFDLKKKNNNYQISNFFFESCPRRYYYKTYKPSKRSKGLNNQYLQNNEYNIYCDYPGCIYNTKIY